MRKKFRERFLDPEVLNRIEAAQNSPETRRRLRRVIRKESEVFEKEV